jgi:plastocyanin
MIKLFLAGLVLVAAAGCSQAGSGTAASTPAAATASAPAAASSAAGAASAAPASGGMDVKVKDFAVDPTTVTVKAGTVTFNVLNQGPTIHNLTVRDSTGKILFGSRDLKDEESQSVSGDLAAGTYDLICTLPGHESLGVKAKLTVTAP